MNLLQTGDGGPSSMDTKSAALLRRMSTKSKSLVFVPDKPEAVEAGTQTEVSGAAERAATLMQRFQEHLEAETAADSAVENVKGATETGAGGMRGAMNVMAGIRFLRSESLGSPVIESFLDEVSAKVRGGWGSSSRGGMELCGEWW